MTGRVPARAGVLTVPGARLYHEVRGSGPGLLIIPTGNGDATPFAPMAAALADRYTVITYDRRGFSRSPLEAPVNDARRLAADVDDAIRLLDRVVGGPGHILGGSSGAIVALAALERRPEWVRTAVAHEPPLASILPDSARWLTFYAELYETYRRRGAEVAGPVFRAAMGMRASTRAPDEVELPRPQLDELLARLRRNQMFWFEHELRTYPAVVPDLTALRSASDRLVLAGGSTARAAFPYRPNAVLAERLGTTVTHFPGGHVGYVTHPFEFAERLAAVLAGDP